MDERRKSRTCTVSLERGTVDALDKAVELFEQTHRVELSRSKMMRKIIMDWIDSQKDGEHGR